MGEAGLWTVRLGELWRCARRVVLFAPLVLAALVFPAGSAEAANLCLSQGPGAGQCSNARGIAADFEILGAENTERVYVADRGNHRINVFEADGNFLFAIGWGVDTGAEALQICTTASGCQAGLSGSGAGQLSSPEFIAVDNVEGSAARHDIYVTDANKRVSRFEEDGSFVTSFEGGGECHELTGSRLPLAIGPAGNVFVAATEGDEPNFTARVEKFGPSGECLGETVLLTGNYRLTALAVDASEDAYAVSERLGGLELRKYDLGTPETELCNLDPGIETNALAMDEAGHLFAAQREKRDGRPGVLQVITEYDVSSCPPTKHVRRFGYGQIDNNVDGLAALHTAEGDVFVNEGEGDPKPIGYLKYPPAGPIAPEEGTELTRIGSANADARAEINPEGKATTFHFDYVEEAQFEIDGFASALSTPTQELSQAAGAFRVNAASGLLGCPNPSTEIGGGSCLKPETKYRWRVVSSNSDGAGLGSAEGPPFETKGPLEIEDLWAMEVGTDAATLGAVVNPVGSETTGHFEYVTDAQFQASGFDEATKVPAGEAELDFGGSETGTKRIATIFPLDPGTVYHYRVAATNVVFKASSSEDFLFSAPETFRTFEPRGPPDPCPNDAFRTGAAALLPDCRAYELVSPLDKANGDIKVLDEFLTTVQPAVVNQSSTSGERLTYGSYRAFDDAVSAPYTSQYIAERDASGWLTHSINPPQDGSIKGSLLFDNEYRFFSEDLCEGWITTFFEPILAPDAIVGYFNLYRRTDQLCGEEESYEAITAATPLNLGLPQSGTNLYQIEPQGHSADGSVNAFTSSDSLAGTLASQPPSCKTSAVCRLRLYLKAEGLGEKPRFACILPSGVAVAAGEDCTAGSFNIPGRFPLTRSPNVKGALSEDGKSIFWSRWTGANPNGPIYLRENPLASGANCSSPEAPCTRDVSKGGEIASGSTGAHFWQGASDGSAALYTTGGDLYRYLTASNTSEAIAGEVLGLVGASDDVKRVYFASKEVLTGEEENDMGAKAKVGAFNLYLHGAGEGGGSYRFIGQLSSGDLNVSGFTATSPILPEPVRHNGQVSADGLAATFASVAPLTGYDNTDAKSGKADTEVFVYDATANGGAGELVCASCNPSGGRPSGQDLAGESGEDFWIAGRIPGSYSTLAEPEVLAPDGSRLIFEATDALVPDDTNGRLDVYEWERAGVGSCEEDDTTFSEAANGCVDLISSGQSLADSEIVDVSPTAAGADVFFTTLESLLPQDYGLLDIYDARIGGGFSPPPPPKPQCAGETCQNPPAAPEFQIEASETNFGPGNMTQKPKKQGCPKGKHKVKKNGKVRCVANKKKGKRR